MDILSHGLWGGVAFGRKNRRSFWLSFLFGIAPDFFSFGIFFTSMIFTGRLFRPDFSSEPPDPSLIPQYVHGLYSITHSLIIFAVFFFLLWPIFQRPILESLAWGFHILLDIFTHSYRFFPTPFLWPISDFNFSGWPWSLPEIFFTNVALLAICYAWFYLVKKPKSS